MNAFNFWDIVLVEDTFTLSDKTTFLGISYKNIGILLFFISSFFALFPLLYQVIKNKINQNQTNLSFNLVVLAYALIPVLFFYFNTQMHERYIHPAFLPIIAFSFYNKKYMLLFLFSIAYFLNLEYAAKFFAFNNYHTLIFEKEFVASIYAIILVILYRNIWLAFKKII